MFIHASEASEFLPVAEGHPVLLDASATEVLGDIETSVSAALLRGFQLHTVLVLLAEGGNTRNIVSPQFQGGNSSALILYDEETVPPELGPQPPMRISLCPHLRTTGPLCWTLCSFNHREYRRLPGAGRLKANLRRVRYPQAVPVAELVELRLLPTGSELYKWHAPSWTSPCPPNSIHGDLGRIRDLDRR